MRVQVGWPLSSRGLHWVLVTAQGNSGSFRVSKICYLTTPLMCFPCVWGQRALLPKGLPFPPSPMHTRRAGLALEGVLIRAGNALGMAGTAQHPSVGLWCQDEESVLFPADPLHELVDGADSGCLGPQGAVAHVELEGTGHLQKG